MNLLLCGNEKVFDGALTELISIMNKTKETINCYIFTMDLTRIKPEYKSISDEQIEFLKEVVKSKNVNNEVQKVDVTDIYEKEFGHCKNENAYCTPYTLLRLLADLVPDMPEKLLYLDIDMMAANDIAQLYNIDISDYEFAAVREKYGCLFIWPDYINAGMLLLNMNKICYSQTKMQFIDLLLKNYYCQGYIMNNQVLIEKIQLYVIFVRDYCYFHIHVQKILNNGKLNKYIKF